jgi:hypothetical protein
LTRARAERSTSGEFANDFEWVDLKVRGMRKRYRVLLLAATVAALVVPVGFALSLESSSRPARLRHLSVNSVTAAGASGPSAAVQSAAVASSVLVSRAAVDPPAAVMVSHSVPDSAKLLLVGTALFGLAAAVRKAI